MYLNEAVIIVTGAARGIGYATAEFIGRRGAAVVVTDLHEDAVDSAVRGLKDQGIEARGFAGDVQDRASVTQTAEEVVAEFGRIDVLVNNAGNHSPAPSIGLSAEHWGREIGTILTGSFFWAQAVGGLSMIPRRRGSIVNVGSGASIAALPDSASYVSAKHGLIGLTKSLAVDWAQYGIRVNCVLPGFTRTQLAEEVALLDPEGAARRIARIPYGSGAKPEDVARAIAFLASDEDSGAISGIAMPIDGAMSALSSGYDAPFEVGVEHACGV